MMFRLLTSTGQVGMGHAYSGLHVGQDVYPPLTGRVLSDRGAGVPNVTVMAEVRMAPGQILNTAYGLQGTLLSLGGSLHTPVLTLPACVTTRGAWPNHAHHLTHICFPTFPRVPLRAASSPRSTRSRS